MKTFIFVFLLVIPTFAIELGYFMASENEKLLTEFESKIGKLMSFCDSLKSENALLKREIAQKEDSIKELILSNEQLKRKYNNLKLAKSIASPDSYEDVNTAKKRLSKLVQDVEKCIALLKS